MLGLLLSSIVAGFVALILGHFLGQASQLKALLSSTPPLNVLPFSPHFIYSLFYMLLFARLIFPNDDDDNM